MTKKRSRFLHDLARGGKAQDLIVQMFNDAGFDSHMDKSARSEWDVVTAYRQDVITTEVKFDAYEQSSGNIAIEVYNPRLGKPSGVTVTKAFFWAHVLAGGVVWLTPVTKLKDHLDKNAPGRIIDRGGDGNATLWLYASKEILPAAFTRVDTMEVDEFQVFVVEQWEEYQ
jgi:hypothetical protein